MSKPPETPPVLGPRKKNFHCTSPPKHNQSLPKKTYRPPPHHIQHVNGLEVKFPHERPYTPQGVLMSRLIQTLDASTINRSCALLESPTGTGKTLALLTASLAWQEKIIANRGLKKLPFQSSIISDAQMNIEKTKPKSTFEDVPTAKDNSIVPNSKNSEKPWQITMEELGLGNGSDQPNHTDQDEDILKTSLFHSSFDETLIEREIVQNDVSNKSPNNDNSRKKRKHISIENEGESYSNDNSTDQTLIGQYSGPPFKKLSKPLLLVQNIQSNQKSQEHLHNDDQTIHDKPETDEKSQESQNLVSFSNTHQIIITANAASASALTSNSNTTTISTTFIPLLEQNQQESEQVAFNQHVFKNGERIAKIDHVFENEEDFEIEQFYLLNNREQVSDENDNVSKDGKQVEIEQQIQITNHHEPVISESSKLDTNGSKDDLESNLQSKDDLESIENHNIQSNDQIISTTTKPETKLPSLPFDHKIPVIFYATRTHSQIKKAVSELYQTSYRPPMSILGGRGSYCINPHVQREGIKPAQRDVECRVRVKTSTCEYALKSEQLSSDGRFGAPYGDYQVWDIEELVEFGKIEKACPYYASRDLAQRALLVFTPYTYLIDPVIRNTLSADLKDAVVIIDEAHNLENQCREHASFYFDLSIIGQICDALEDFKQFVHELLELKSCPPELKEVWNNIQILLPVFNLMYDWLYDVSGRDCQYEPHGYLRRPATLNSEQQQSSLKFEAEWKDEDLVEALNQWKINSKNIGFLNASFTKAMSLYDQLEPSYQDLPVSVIKHIERFLLVVNFMLFQDRLYLSDFRFNVSKSRAENGKFQVEGNFVCLYPAILFRELLTICRSVVLVSGTLNPVSSIRAELGIEPIIEPQNIFSVSTNHVISDPSQLCVLRISEHSGLLNNNNIGPPIKLKGDHAGKQSLQFQDAIGDSILKLIAVIPDGVLVFFSSYTDIDIFMQRWTLNGTYSKMQQLKPITRETKNDINSVFQQKWNAFCHNIESGRGALYFGVFRGKISEGMDFKDEYARAVIVVGIPFPAFKDPTITQKRLWNDNHYKFQKDALVEARLKEIEAASEIEMQNEDSNNNNNNNNYQRKVPNTAQESLFSIKSVLNSGSIAVERSVSKFMEEMQAKENPEESFFLSSKDWYALDAFRAINQAVGRCIRHSKDFGAIIFLDERYGVESNFGRLSKWVRANARPPASLNSCIETLKHFYVHNRAYIKSNSSSRNAIVATEHETLDEELEAMLAAAEAPHPTQLRKTSTQPNMPIDSANDALATETLSRSVSEGNHIIESPFASKSKPYSNMFYRNKR